VIIGDLMGGVTGGAAGFRKARRRPDRMADNPPDPHSSLLLFIFFSIFGGALASVSTS
jgi:hypothetical protein